MDQYTGGAEHAVMHLLYARFFTKAMRDLGLLDFDEPFIRLFNQGHILSEGEKMSKSRGNVVAPDEYVGMYGADAVRCYLMFIGPWDQGGSWSESGSQRHLPVAEPPVGAGAARPGRARRGPGRRGGRRRSDDEACTRRFAA